MYSMDYKILLGQFSENLQRIEEDIELAADGDIEGEEKGLAINAARDKLSEYERIVDLLTADSKVLAEEFKKTFNYNITSIRNDFDRCN